LSLGKLKPGRHTIRVRDSESVEIPGLALAPRIDMLCVTRNAAYVPQDKDARR
jgi:hypothetical protein